MQTDERERTRTGLAWLSPFRERERAPRDSRGDTAGTRGRFPLLADADPLGSRDPPRTCVALGNSPARIYANRRQRDRSMRDGRRTSNPGDAHILAADLRTHGLFTRSTPSQMSLHRNLDTWVKRKERARKKRQNVRLTRPSPLKGPSCTRIPATPPFVLLVSSPRLFRPLPFPPALCLRRFCRSPPLDSLGVVVHSSASSRPAPRSRRLSICPSLLLNLACATALLGLDLFGRGTAGRNAR